MSQRPYQFDEQPTRSQSEPVPLPCFAKCINLQAMHPQTLKRLGLVYQQYYILTDSATNPTPSHLGSWVKVSGIGERQPDGSREWIPASFFFINTIIWPN